MWYFRHFYLIVTKTGIVDRMHVRTELQDKKVLKIRSAVLEMLHTDRRTNRQRDMATCIDTFLQIVVAKAPEQMNAVSTLPKARRI